MELIERAQLVTAARDWAASGAARCVREGAGLSRYEMAELVGVVPSTIQRWENGAVRPHGDPGARYGEVLQAMMQPHWHLARRAGGHV